MYTGGQSSSKYSSREEVAIELDKHKHPKLYLGCFNKKIHGFINVDIRDDVNPDLCLDIFDLANVPDNSIETILSVHTLEHLDRKNAQSSLERWFQVLKPGGKVYVCVPNMKAVCEHYIYHGQLSDLFSALGGSQRHPFDYHLSHYDFATLKQYLENAGFKNVDYYDAWKTPWSHVDSYAFAYYPHKQFETGKLMSLNVEATK